MRGARCSPPRVNPRGRTMLDVAFLVLGVAGFAALLGYTVLCERH
jgi:hypothetical protein